MAGILDWLGLGNGGFVPRQAPIGPGYGVAPDYGPSPGGVLSGAQQQQIPLSPPGPSKLGLFGATLSDIGANLNGHPENATGLATYRTMAMRAQLMQAINSTDPKIRQQAYSAALSLGIDPTPFERAQASQAMPELLKNMRDQTISLPGASIKTSFGTTDVPSSPVTMSAMSLPDALSATNSPELSSQMAPDIIKQQMDLAAKANEPFTLTPGEHRFVGGKDIASVPEETPTVLTQEQAAQKNLPPLPPGSFYKFSPKEGVSIERSDPNLLSPDAQKQRISIAAAEAGARQQAQNPQLPPGSKVPGITGDPLMHPETAGYTSIAVPGSGGLTQSAIDQAAIEYATTGKFPSGMGISSQGVGGQRKTAIQNRAGEMNAGGMMAANAGQVKALTTSLTAQTKARNQIGTALDNAKNQGSQIVSKFAGKINEDMPLVNAIINPAKFQLDPGLVGSLKGSLADLSSTYSQVFARNGHVTDQVRRKADDIANGNISMKDLNTIIQQMNAQGDIVLQGYDKNIAGIQGQYRGILGGNAAPNPAPASGGGGRKSPPPPPPGFVVHP